MYIGWDRGFRLTWLSWVWNGFAISRVSAEGQLEWSRPLLDYFASFPCLGMGGRVYLVDGNDDYSMSDSYFYALTDAGRFVWGPRQDPPFAGYHHNQFTIGQDGTLYALDGTSLLAVDPADGNLKWRLEAGGRWIYNQCPSIAANGTIYSGHSTGSVGEVWAVNPNGSRRWKVADTQASSATGTSLARDGTIYASFLRRDEAVLTAITPEGQIAWQTPLIGRPVFPPSIDSHGRLCLQTVAESEAVLECYKPSGEYVWDRALPASGGWAASAVVIDGRDNLYMILRDDPSYTVRLLSYTRHGELRWQYDFYWGVGHQVPVIGPDGTLYFTAMDEPNGPTYLYALGRGEAPDPAWLGR